MTSTTEETTNFQQQREWVEYCLLNKLILVVSPKSLDGCCVGLAESPSEVEQE